MRRKFKPICLILAFSLLTGAFIFPSAAADNTRNLCGADNTYLKIGKDDMYAAQVNLSGDASALSVKCTNYGSAGASAVIAVYEYKTDYTTSLIGTPKVRREFKGFTDKTALTLEGDFGQGEYIVTVVSPDGNCGVMKCAEHASQLCYKNNASAKMSISVAVTYKSAPNKDYLAPTKQNSGSEEQDLAPCMDFYMDFRLEETYDKFKNAGTNDMSLKYENGKTVFHVNKSGDPFVWLDTDGAAMPLDKYSVVSMSLRLPENSPLSGQMFFCTDVTGVSEANSQKFNYKNDGGWQVVNLSFKSYKDWQGLLTSLRWDTFQSADDGPFDVEVEYIAFFTSIEAAEAFDGDFGQYKAPDKPKSEDKTEWVIDGTLDEETLFAEKGWGFISRKNVLIENGAVYAQPYTDYSIYSCYLPGDDYGSVTSGISFDVTMTYGYIDLGLRLIVSSDGIDRSGLWLRLNADGTLTLSEHGGYSQTVATGVDFSQVKTLAITDRHGSMEITLGGELICGLIYPSYGNAVTVTDKNGGEIGRFEYENLPYNGYFRIDAVKVNGYLDNIKYSHVNTEKTSVKQEYKTDYSTWVATDDLGRTTPMNIEVGDAKEKYVGVFYFFTHSADMGGREIDDVTKIYLRGGVEGVTKRMQEKAGRSGIYWAEPYFGYYNSYDAWIYRKHAEMLSAAGVDFIFLDNSNDNFYLDQLEVLLNTWLDIRKNGGNTPQVVFMYGDMPFTTLDGLYQMGEQYILNEKYADLMFKWEGKPLVLGNSDTPNGKTWTVSGTTPQSKSDYRAKLKENPELNEFYQNGYKEMLEKVTIRKCWAWQAGTYGGYWDWLQDSPQAKGTNSEGVFEQMAVEFGQHAHTGKGRSLITQENGLINYDNSNSFGFTLGTARYGYYFAEQFEYALKQDPQVILITGWNEWYAGVQKAADAQTTGATSSPGFALIDQFTPEYSRDAEPMKIRDGEGSVGFGDNCYYQMVSYVRKFKGLDKPVETVNNPDISLDAADIDAQWAEVQPTFTDSVNDTAYRSEYSFSSAYLYVNSSGRNDIDYAKISQDKNYIYFYVHTAEELVKADGGNWMNLFINTDKNSETGWEGYDFVINRSRDGRKTTVEALSGGWSGTECGSAEYVCGKQSITVKVDKTLLGFDTDKIADFDFKWADNSTENGDVMQFMDLGDAAPDSRFAFRYTAPETLEKPSEENTTAVEDTQNGETENETDSEQTTASDESKRGCCSNAAALGIIGTLGAGYAVIKKRKKGKNA